MSILLTLMSVTDGFLVASLLCPLEAGLCVCVVRLECEVQGQQTQ